MHTNLLLGNMKGKYGFEDLHVDWRILKWM
jgi:hypothetical protein